MSEPKGNKNNINDTADESSGLITAKDGHTYHKSTSANATVAPTNQATIDKAQGAGINPEKLEFITIIDYEWNLKGNLDLDVISTDYGFSPVEIKALLSDELVLAALTERGIGPKQLVTLTDNAVPTNRHAKLTPVQLIAANRMMDITDTRSDKKKLQDLGVSTLVYSSWLRDGEFTKYMRERAESLIGDRQHEAMLALMDRVSQRDVSAIKYYHELIGRHVPASSTQQATSGHDMQTLVIRIIEIVIDEVSVPDDALRISEKLKALVSGAQIAGVLEAPQVITVPEIAKARELTPGVKALMEQGVGYDS